MYPRSREKDPGEPKWLGKIEALIIKQTASMSTLTEKLTHIFEEKPDNQDDASSSNPPPAKRPKPTAVPLQMSSPPCLSDSEDEFDKRFGHLFGADLDEDESEVHENNTDNLLKNCFGESEDENNNLEEVSDGEESIDNDLMQLLDKTPNWDTSSSIRKFIANTIDHPLPEEVIKRINEEFIPSADMEEFFTAPKMPRRLYKAMTKIKRKNILKTELTLYATQSEIFVAVKPLIEALRALKPLGSQVSQAREHISVSLQGYYSISLEISKARRENVRPLFKEALADVLFTYEPSHLSIFGGESFASQVEKAAKEAKLDLSWASFNPKKKRTFRQNSPQGFGNRGRFNQNNSGRNNYNKANYNKSNKSNNNIKSKPNNKANNKSKESSG